jgi:superfamily II DNA or RNA helicase
MKISDALARHFPAAVRLRGESYVSQGCVEIVTGDGRTVRAEVTGSSLYVVSLSRDRDRLLVYCSCPHHGRDLAPCKHIWATIVAAVAGGHLQKPGDALPRRIAPVMAEPWDDELDDDFDDDALAEADFDLWPEPSFGSAHEPAYGQPRRRVGTRPGLPPALPGGQVSRLPGPPPPPAWQDLVASAVVAGLPPPRLAPVEELQYVIDVPVTMASGSLMLELMERGRKAGGGWTKPRLLRLNRSQIAARVPLESDRRLLALLAGVTARQGEVLSWRYGPDPHDAVTAHCPVHPDLAPLVIPLLCDSGRAWLRLSPQEREGPPLTWDSGEPWQLWLEVRRDTAAGDFGVVGSLRRGDERMPLTAAVLLVPGGLVFTSERAARLDTAGRFSWISLLRRVGRIHVPGQDGEDLLAWLLTQPDLPPLDLPPEMRHREVRGTPVPRLLLLAASGGGPWWQRAELSFLYGTLEAAPGSPRRALYQAAERTLWLRDAEAEDRARARLAELGFQPAVVGAIRSPALQVERGRTGEVVRALLAEGWRVDAQGRRVRAPGAFRLGVRSQADWFDLEGGVDFGGVFAPLPELLAALRRDEGTVELGDGSVGLLPEEWLRRFAPLAGLGRHEGDGLRFHTAQASLLDALLTAAPEATCDAAFTRARQRLAGFAGVQPAAAPRGFQGELRAYQQAGLGWLRFLRELGLGGCLADDMGLGKTIQVLALFESLRVPGRRPEGGLSLVVAPRSLVFNWLAEAERFTPGLRLLNHTGGDRAKEQGDGGFAGADVVVTTYGTLRRDIALLSSIEFDTIVLDEAQAIKNPDSQSARAARLLRGRQRLALTGTPVENHLGDLWSLLEFLNPGITGASSLLRAGGGALRQPDEATRALLAHALRPFILRRTKEQVAAELPRKFEQTLFCELPQGQRRLYDELRRHYRTALGERIEQRGLGRTKILVLEALLRLRQAACHPGLIARERAPERCAKLDVLLPQLAEVLDEGHKALVFSQFTSFLAIVRQHLDRTGVCYAYLDGRTRDRAERVARFQTDPACKLFLISLKAGGLGLNLTAADYVYLLDPWWNPAVEAQAIDRAHRIGQQRQVFAYRIVAKDTVEEKILQLQQSKRELADSIITADDSLLRRLTRADLDLLLS